jgi:hypothetical protein
MSEGHGNRRARHNRDANRSPPSETQPDTVLALLTIPLEAKVERSSKSLNVTDGG